MAIRATSPGYVVTHAKHRWPNDDNKQLQYHLTFVAATYTTC